MAIQTKTRLLDTTIQPGDVVRSYDFDFTDTCYVEGLVIGEENERYVILVETHVHDGEMLPPGRGSLVGRLTYPPINGILRWPSMNPTCGVQRIGRQ